MIWSAIPMVHLSLTEKCVCNHGLPEAPPVCSPGASPASRSCELVANVLLCCSVAPQQQNLMEQSLTLELLPLAKERSYKCYKRLAETRLHPSPGARSMEAFSSTCLDICDERGTPHTNNEAPQLMREIGEAGSHTPQFCTLLHELTGPEIWVCGHEGCSAAGIHGVTSRIIITALTLAPGVVCVLTKCLCRRLYDAFNKQLALFMFNLPGSVMG